MSRLTLVECSAIGGCRDPHAERKFASPIRVLMNGSFFSYAHFSAGTQGALESDRSRSAKLPWYTETLPGKVRRANQVIEVRLHCSVTDPFSSY
jgi:hypothetical protein